MPSAAPWRRSWTRVSTWRVRAGRERHRWPCACFCEPSLRRCARKASIGSSPAAKSSCRWRLALKNARRSHSECACPRQGAARLQRLQDLSGARGDDELAQILGIGVYAQRLTDQARAPRQLRARVAHVHVGDVRAHAARERTPNPVGHGIVQQLRLLAQQPGQDAQAHGRTVDAEHVPAHHLQRREATETGVRRAVVVPDRMLEQFLQFLGRDTTKAQGDHRGYAGRPAPWDRCPREPASWAGCGVRRLPRRSDAPGRDYRDEGLAGHGAGAGEPGRAPARECRATPTPSVQTSRRRLSLRRKLRLLRQNSVMSHSVRNQRHCWLPA